jgi:nucleotide-binding universal stress UspA family protein
MGSASLADPAEGERRQAMSEWKKIGCAVDFSDPSRVALEEAVEQARRTGAELVVIHVYVPPPTNPADVIVSPAEVTRMAADEMDRTLEAWRADAETRLGRVVGVKVLFGDPAGEIVRWARDHGSDLLVLGTHGRTGLRRFILGSVAERALREAPGPVLVSRQRKLDAAREAAEEAAQYT